MSDPDGAAWLLELETRSRRQGSGITQQHLGGNWRLVELWDRQARPQPAQARLLQALQARLEIQPVRSEDGVAATGLELCNSVRLGALELAFQGPGWLQGRRPLLRFRFERMQLSLGPWRLWQQPLAAPAQGKVPFFALIGTGRDRQGPWLLARGRGGGLARWRA
ncbi:MAG: hypothetical protein KFB97_12925 [Cyanobium sp. M30B3]|nr:MAG: hypothetical protein KFB97_12925 [Cyanobium sp. M30B3]